MLLNVAVDWVAVKTSRAAGLYSKATTSWWSVRSAALTGTSRAVVPLAVASRRVLPWALTRMVPVVGWPVTAMLPVMRAGLQAGGDRDGKLLAGLAGHGRDGTQTGGRGSRAGVGRGGAVRTYYGGCGDCGGGGLELDDGKQGAGENNAPCPET